MIKRISILLLAAFVLVGCDSQTAEDHLNRAIAYENEGEFRAAVIELKNALQKQPDNADARYRLGLLYEWGGDFATTVKELDRALDLGHERETLLVPLLRAKIQLGRHQEVLGTLENEPELSAELTALKGLAYLRGGDVETAVELFEAALGMQENVFDAQMGLVEVLAPADPGQALTYARAATIAYPKRREGWYSQANLELATEQTEPALESFQRVISLPGGEIVGALGAARVLLLDNRTEEAKVHVDNALKFQSIHPIARYYAAYIAFLDGDLDLSLAELRESQRVLQNHPPALFLLGTVQFERGEENQATSALRRYLAEVPRGLPQNVAARKILATIHMRADDLEAAVAVLEGELASLDAQGLAMLGVAYGRLGDHANGSRLLSQAVALTPDLANLRTQLAISLMAEGNEAQARSELEAAISLDDQSFVSDELLVRMHLRGDDVVAAMAVAARQVEMNPESPLGHNLLGIVHVAMKEPEVARAHFERAVALEGDFVPALENLARLARDQGRPDDALARYRQLLDVAPANETAALALALDAQQRGDPMGSVAILRDLTARNSTTVAGRIALGEALIRLDDHDGAVEVAEAALTLAPRDPGARLLHIQSRAANGEQLAALREMRALAREQNDLSRNQRILWATLESAAGTPQRAIDALAGWVESHPEDHDAAFRLAGLEIQVDLRIAQERFERLLRQAPEGLTPSVLNNLAWIYSELGDERALPTARNAHELAPDDVAILDTLGWVLVRAGHVDEAVPLLRKAVTQSGAHPTIAYHLAVALERAGDTEGAAAAARGSLDRTNDFPEAGAARELLGRVDG